MKGEITPQGAKNEALEVICATLLTADPVRIKNIPEILDVNNLIKLLQEIGVKVTRHAQGDFTFQADQLNLSYLDSVAFVQKSELPKGRYPDGADGAGFPVEFYVSGDPKMFYCELEILGPLKVFKVGGKSTHTVRWSLHDLPSKDVNSPAVVEAVQGLIYGS